ncbi:MAG TPA: fibrobacter succinogenes major paralogous domain-containing protein [Bacteroidales bacterium]|jgi:uncharacterized protein (TIGR02145 family)|nr:fibrobacter succinogenes major paralogous domain-containing protein [Bacteroidales bacterium]HOD88843.1 fibrobacter succinogenes major paralogous domain-containing protein [Bacteroidales bacterium]HPX77120.1 fibrobacter succinogenes major paralogous domain-containing protein [Bacteroidales bacterium]
MKNICRNIISIFLFFGVVFYLNSCKKEEIPTLKTGEVSNITENSATLSAKVSKDGDSEIIVRGFVWNTTKNPSLEANIGFSENGSGVGDFTHNVEGLMSETTYYVRAYATNEIGTAYGNEVSFTTNAPSWNGTPCTDCETITDIDGNIYRTVKIGTQCWLADNLKTTKYNDGTEIQNVTLNTEWNVLSTGAFCWYNNDANNKENYGALYNYYAVETGKLCPEGWHVATDNEWKELEGFVDSEYKVGNSIWNNESWRGSDVGIRLKASYFWLGGSQQDKSDSHGFSALPGGVRNGDTGGFERLEEWGLWWSSKNDVETNVYRRNLEKNKDNIARFPSNPKSGYSIRCIKN